MKFLNLDKILVFKKVVLLSYSIEFQSILNVKLQCKPCLLGNNPRSEIAALKADCLIEPKLTSVSSFNVPLVKGSYSEFCIESDIEALKFLKRVPLYF